MAVRRVCDRCEKVLGEYGSHKILDRRIFWSKEYDLCNECYAEFDEWLKGKQEPEWTGEGD